MFPRNKKREECLSPGLVRRAALLLALCSSAAWAQTSPTAEDLVAKNLAARGGADALAAIKTVRFDGKLVFPGDFQLTYEETRARVPDGTGEAVRINAALQGLTVVQAYDGANAWRINPFEGRRDAERMSEDEARALADDNSIEGPLLLAHAQNAKVSYLGREDFDGTLGYKLKVVQPDGDEFVYLLDPDTFLEIKMTESRKLRGAPQVTEYELGDYEKVGGVYFPMSIDSWPSGQTNQRQRVIIAKGEANVPVTPALFAQPADRPAPSAAGPKDAAKPPHDQEKPPNAAKEPPSTNPKSR